VEKKRQGDLLIIRFSDGEDLLAGMKKALRQENVESGVILGGVGMVKQAALSFYKGQGQYETAPVGEEAELCSINGNISTMGEELVVHVHAVVGKKGGAALAGHFSSGKVNMTAEVAVLAVPQRLTRKLDPETGLRTLLIG
jgi:predicted DNA-binding protein with PD1-like motif